MSQVQTKYLSKLREVSDSVRTQVETWSLIQGKTMEHFHSLVVLVTRYQTLSRQGQKALGVLKGFDQLDVILRKKYLIHSESLCRALRSYLMKFEIVMKNLEDCWKTANSWDFNQKKAEDHLSDSEKEISTSFSQFVKAVENLVHQYQKEFKEKKQILDKISYLDVALVESLAQRWSDQSNLPALNTDET